ncbi:hypothetical protein EHP00_1086 [Ecytonucleospora hepatopenaei]|uniref:t-SNARE coiled-coil homology domain-containing protein n=1 Tax=Ecytonucleospora hepatopenaei TaxID=646526 RepID=A0A1W0E558_9MICR|nr:hypothetical protein EHP00_1086 [Ecytonucleospora hepatopenaei]
MDQLVLNDIENKVFELSLLIDNYTDGSLKKFSENNLHGNILKNNTSFNDQTIVNFDSNINSVSDCSTENINEISNKEEMLSSLSKYSKNELAAVINKNIIEIDTLIQQIPLPKEISQVYVNSKLKYFSKYSDARVYESVRKSNKLDQIYEDVQEIAEINKYIQQTVENDEELIDGILIKLTEQEEETANARNELHSASQRAKNKSRFYSFLYCTCGIFLLMVGYKIIK